MRQDESGMVEKARGRQRRGTGADVRIQSAGGRSPKPGGLRATHTLLIVPNLINSSCAQRLSQLSVKRFCHKARRILITADTAEAKHLQVALTDPWRQVTYATARVSSIHSHKGMTMS